MNSSSRGKKGESKMDGNLGSIKMTIPTFQGKKWFRIIHGIGEEGTTYVWLS